ncbi:MAG: alpha/beta hydrolase [Kibdelosporangium sp.]
MLSSVVSPDTTVVGYETLGSGPPMVLVHGGTADRTRWAPVRQKLATKYTVHIMDRRGRGLSTAEAPDYSIAREAEDIAAVVAAVGEDVHLVGHSYGALGSLEAALLTSSIGRMTLYEPPMSSPGLPVLDPEALVRMRSIADPELLLVTFYQEALQLEPSVVDAMKGTAIWRARLAAVHTIVRELTEITGYAPDERLATIDVPVRMLVGSESPAYLRTATERVAARIASAEVVTLQGHGHQAIDHDPELFVSEVFADA